MRPHGRLRPALASSTDLAYRVPAGWVYAMAMSGVSMAYLIQLSWYHHDAVALVQSDQHADIRSYSHLQTASLFVTSVSIIAAQFLATSATTQGGLLARRMNEHMYLPALLSGIGLGVWSGGAMAKATGVEVYPATRNVGTFMTVGSVVAFAAARFLSRPRQRAQSAHNDV